MASIRLSGKPGSVCPARVRYRRDSRAWCSSLVHTSEAGGEQRQVLRSGMPAVDVLEHQMIAVRRWQ
jgi:hypothetical protein